MQHHCVETNGLGSWSTPNADPSHPQPGSDGTGSPRGLRQRRWLVGKVTPGMRYGSSWEQGVQGLIQSACDPKARENCTGGSHRPHTVRISRGISHLPLEVAQGGHSPREQRVVNGFGKFIHVFPFLFTLTIEIPYTKHSSSSLPPTLEQREPSQGNTDLSCSLRNTQGTAFLFFLLCLLFFSPISLGTTLGIHPTCRSVS